MSLLLLGLVAGIGVRSLVAESGQGLARNERRASSGAAAQQLKSRIQSEQDVRDDSAAMARSRFVLREWLSDVRGCLEREAATRGLSLDLRCERALPEELESDPGWLGGLIVAMGREALDATADQKIVLEVADDAGETIRFEVDAGSVELTPLDAMERLAKEIGASFERGRPRRLALVVPQMAQAPTD